jgi:hypothetical protein
MSDIKSRQSSDNAQGGEGTNSLNGKSYEALTKDIGKVENTVAEVPAKDVGTK